MKLVVDCALHAPIRGLPDDISIFVDTWNTKDLSEAFEHALHAEERRKYTEKARNVASSYHISRTREHVPERPRSPSPLSKQIPYGFYRFLGEKFSDWETEDLQEYPQEELGGEYSDRVRKVIQSLHVSHLAPEEKDHVYHWAEDYADIFYLNGEKVTSTHLIQNRIPTIYDKIIV